MEDLRLLMAVREVSSLAAPQRPDRISQRQFDEAVGRLRLQQRALSKAFHASAGDAIPRAKHIAEQLGISWAEVLEIAHAPISQHAFLLGRKGVTQQNWLTERYIVFILKFVAHKLDAETVTPGEYRELREQLLKRDKRSYRHGRQLLLPTENQIRVFYEDDETTLSAAWEKALTAAGLATGTAKPNIIQQIIPTRIEAIERFCEHYGYPPSRANLEKFLKGNGIAASTENGELWSVSLEHWRKQREVKGLPALGPQPKRGQHPDYSKNLGAARPGEYLYRGKWEDKQACVDWVIRYLDEQPANTRTTQRHYADWARQQSGAPYPHSFNQHGGWETVRRLAHEEMKGGDR